MKEEKNLILEKAVSEKEIIQRPLPELKRRESRRTSNYAKNVVNMTVVYM